MWRYSTGNFAKSSFSRCLKAKCQDGTPGSWSSAAFFEHLLWGRYYAECFHSSSSWISPQPLQAAVPDEKTELQRHSSSPSREGLGWQSSDQITFCSDALREPPQNGITFKLKGEENREKPHQNWASKISVHRSTTLKVCTKEQMVLTEMYLSSN